MIMRTRRDPKTRRNNIHVTLKRHGELCKVAKVYEISLKEAVELVFKIGKKQVGVDLLMRDRDEKKNHQKNQEVAG